MAETQERQLEEAKQAADKTVDDLEERSDKLGEHIDGARKRWDQAQQSEGVPSAAGDWEDSEPDDSTGEDPSGFDDPESVDLDDDLADEDEE